MALKGIGYGCKTQADVDSVRSLNTDWFYTWSDSPNMGGPELGEFVPMLYSDAGTPNRITRLPAALAALKPEATHLLGFNEPDLAGQATMSVDEARAAWPTLQTTGLRLGSPATISPSSAWLKEFMLESKTLQNPDFKIDFVACHIYQNPHVGTFLSKVDALHDEFGLPVWVTETSVAKWKDKTTGLVTDPYSREEVNEYLLELWGEVQKRPWLERFAWKTRATSDPEMGSAALFNSNGTRTSTGVVYANLPKS